MMEWIDNNTTDAMVLIGFVVMFFIAVTLDQYLTIRYLNGRGRRGF